MKVTHGQVGGHGSVEVAHDQVGWQCFSEGCTWSG